MKKLIFFAVLLYSTLAQLRAQTCNTCQGGVIAQCPTGAPHDVKNVYICFKDTEVLGIGEGQDCQLKIANNHAIFFTPHKDVVIHKTMNLVLPALPGKSIRLSTNPDLISISAISMQQVQTITFNLTAGKNRFFYAICEDATCTPIVTVDPQTGEETTTLLSVTVSSFEVEYKPSPTAYGAANMPDAIWELSIAANEYDHPVQTPYTGISAGLAVPRPGKAHAYIKYGGTKGLLDKPLIFVDGIDFSKEEHTDESITVNGTDYQSKTIRHGSTGWDILLTGREESTIDVTTGQVETFGAYPVEFQKLLNEGYDIIMLDFADGSTYMQKNAELVIKLIERVHNVTNKEIVLVGASMGGQVCRYALTKMETQGKDHCVTHYVSFDSPNQGANIPLFMQGTAWALFDYKINNVSAVSDAWASVNLPASLQLLQEPFQSAVNAGKIKLVRNNVSVQANDFIANNNYGMRNAFVAQLENQGSYPKNTRNLAISCGSIKGTPQTGLGTSGGEKMYGVQLEGKFPKIKDKITISSMGLFTLAGNMTPNISYGQVFYNLQFGNWSWGSYEVTINTPRTIMGLALPNIDATAATLAANCLKQPVPIPSTYVASVATGVTMAPLDNSPGGFRDDLIRLVDGYVTTAQGLVPSGGKVAISLTKTPSTPLFKTSFISTISALDLKGVGLFDDISLLNAKQLFKDKKSPFESFYAPVTNLAHVQLDNRMISDFLLPQLKNFGINNRGDLTVTYNYGYERNRITDITVKNAGQLWVNENGATGFVAASPEAASSGSVFDIYTADCGPIVVKDGGEMRLGSATSTKSGTVTINRNTHIDVLAGGVMNSHNASQVTIAGSAVFNILGGITTLRNESRVIIENNGIFNLNGGTISIAGKSQIVVKSGGTLQINPAATVNFNDYAKIIVEQGGKLILEKGNGGEVVFNGNGIDNPIVLQGEMIVNAPIRMKGSAYFNVHPTHLLTLYTAFQLTGDNHEMVRLEKDAYWKINYQNVTFNTGIVNYGLNTRVVLPAKKDATFNNIGFVGSSALLGLSKVYGNDMFGLVSNGVSSPNSLLVESCYFNYLDICINLDNKTYADAPQVFNVTSSRFTDYRFCGVFVRTGETFKAIGSYFKSTVPTYKIKKEIAEFPVSKYPPALVLTDFNQFQSWLGKSKVLLEGGIIEGNDFDFVQKWFDKNPTTSAGSLISKEPYPDNQSLTVEDTDLKDNYSFSVYLDNVPNLIMQNGQIIKNAFNAILARGNTSVNMYSSSRLMNNGIGLNMIGLPTSNAQSSRASGRFTMDCSSLVKNVYGLLGNNIILDIDELLNSKGLNYNTFVQYTGYGKTKANGRYFDYIFKYALQTPQIPATYNKWFPNLPVQGVDYYIANTLNGGPASVALDLGNIIPTQVPNCELLPGKIYNDKDLSDVASNNPKGFMTINGVYQAALPIFWSGMSNFYAGNEADAASNFSQLAAISEAARNSLNNPYAQLMIDVAKTMVYAPPSDSPILGKLQRAKITTTIYPNPTDDILNIHLEKGVFSINIMDTQGRIVYKQSAEGDVVINTDTWLSGIYQVFITNKDTGAEVTEKVVVMRD